MKRTRHTPEQIVCKLREIDRLLVEGMALDEMVRRLGVSHQTYHRWRTQFGAVRPDDMADCSWESTNIIETKAMEQVATELNLDQYRLISFVIPESLNCQFVGYGYAPGRNSVIVGEKLHAGAVSHEWGHNLGLMHPKFMRCRVNNILVQFASSALRGQGACTSEEGGDMFPRTPYYHLGAVSFLSRFELGWLREGDKFMIEYRRAPSAWEYQCGTYDNIKKVATCTVHQRCVGALSE